MPGNAVSDKLSINNEMAQLDKKRRGFYDELTDQERKKFSTYLMIRWSSAVEGSRDLQEFYVIAANQRLNKHFFSVNRHPKLQWLMATAVSPDIGVQRHRWIAPKKKDSNNTVVQKRLAELFPNMKTTDIENWSRLVTPAELKQYDRDHGA
jgi:hypothetical protein